MSRPDRPGASVTWRDPSIDAPDSGVKKTSKGWLAWFVNNKGVKSYFREPEEFDTARTAHVRVKVKATGRVVEAKVPPGGYRLVEITDGE